MKRSLLFSLFVFITWTLPASAPPSVPKHLEFCGMQLTLSPKAKERAQEIVDQLHASPKSYEELVQRSHLYMPFIQEALEIVGVPDDLKYLAVVESWLKGDAVSKSNAVGFWQFKDFTAREVGLLINQQVDERKHIFRSSIGAGRYLYGLNQQFGNWIYAIIGYNRGGRGAIPFTDTRYYGKNKMTIPGDLHRYALKAIAYKIALEDEINAKGPVAVWLEPKSNGRTTSVAKLVKKNAIDGKAFRENNLWITGSELPADRFFTYYIPHYKEYPKEDLSDPNKGVYLNAGPVVLTELDGDPTASISTSSSTSTEAHSKNYKNSVYNLNFKRYPLVKDAAANKEFTLVKEQETLIEVAVRKGVSIENLRKWNDLPRGASLTSGEVLLLKPKHKVKIHRVRKGQTLVHISRFYEVSIAQIRKKNRMSEGEHIIYPGQKLYLRKKRPKKEGVVILELMNNKPSKPKLLPLKNKPKVVPATATVTPPKPVESTSKPIPAPIPKTEEEAPQPATLVNLKIGSHQVQKGETLWSISRKYNMSVEEVQLLNGLSNNDIDEDQLLKVKVPAGE